MNEGEFAQLGNNSQENDLIGYNIMISNCHVDFPYPPNLAFTENLYNTIID